MSASFKWEEFLAEVAKRVPPQQFKAWIEQVSMVDFNDHALRLSAPTLFSRDWVEDQYGEIFQAVLRDLYGLILEVRVDVGVVSSGIQTKTQPEIPVTEDPKQQDFPSSNGGSWTPPPKDDMSALLRGSSAKTKKEETPSLFDFPPQAPSKESFSAPTHEPQTTGTPSEDFNSEPSQQMIPLSVRDMAAPIIRTLGQPLNPKHTFETFVVGASNQFAHAAARAVAEQPAIQYNPLFIYSDAGLGKTHLLHAIGNYVLRANPKAKICYISAEKFANDLIESIQHGKMPAFREKYRDSYDILLMDDIQFIAGKDRTQEEFFHTFNALHSSRRQIVVTSDKFPKDIPGLEERIRTRFEWGLIADIQAPEIETRIAILRAKAEIDDIYLPNDVALFLASNIKSNIRELEGSLIRLGAQASLSGTEIGLDMAKQLLRNLIKEPSNSISPDAIQDAVARHFGIKVSDLKGRDRSRRVSLPRQITMYLIRKYCEKSYPDIGILLGGKDHSTVLHGVKSVTSDIEHDPEIRRHVEAIQNSL